jgi:hypothetical protein
MLPPFQGMRTHENRSFGKREVGSPRKIQASMNAGWRAAAIAMVAGNTTVGSTPPLDFFGSNFRLYHS